MLKLNRQGLLLSALMLAGLTAALCGPIGRFLPGWQPLYLVGASLLIALEAGMIHHSFRTNQLWFDELLRYIVPEIFVLAIVMRVATALAGGTGDLRAAAVRWLYDPLSIFDPGFIIALLFGLLLGLIAHMTMSDLLVLEPRESELALAQRDDMQTITAFAQHDRTAALKRISGRFIGGGVLLLIALGIESVDLDRIANPSLPVSRLSAAAAVVYFMSGFLLYSHARLAMLRARWQLDGAHVAEGVPQRWLRVSWITVAGVVSLAAILPRTYGMGLVATLQWAIGLVGYGIALIGYALTSLLGALAILSIMLLSMFGSSDSTTTNMPPIEFVPPEVEPPPGTFEPQLWAALLFWACIGLLAAYAVQIVLQRNPGLIHALTSRGPLAWLLRQLGWLWRDTRAWAGQASERVRTALQRRALAQPARAPALRLGRLAPRDLIRYFYRSLLQRAAGGGAARQASQTPYEYSADLAARLPEAQQDLAELTESFVVAEYSQRPLERADAQRMRRPWERLRRRLRQLTG